MAERYTLALGDKLDADLTKVAQELEVSKSEAIRRAIVLLRHAVRADKVEFTAKDGQKQVVLIK